MTSITDATDRLSSITTEAQLLSFIGELSIGAPGKVTVLNWAIRNCCSAHAQGQKTSHFKNHVLVAYNKKHQKASLLTPSRHGKTAR